MTALTGAVLMTLLASAAPPAARCSDTLTDRSNLALAVTTGSARTESPASSSAGAAWPWNASITWNSGCRDSDRCGFSTSTSRSNGSS